VDAAIVALQDDVVHDGEQRGRERPTGREAAASAKQPCDEVARRDGEPTERRRQENHVLGPLLPEQICCGPDEVVA
jgi:hypothetical protein